VRLDGTIAKFKSQLSQTTQAQTKQAGQD